MASGMKKKNTGLRFRGSSEHTLDSKGRLNIPSKFRQVLQGAYTESLVITNWQKNLKAYPVSEWEKVEDKLIEQAPSLPGFSDLFRYVISGLIECPLDKQGRILLPSSMRNELGIGGEVVLNGMLNHFEIWDKGAWADVSRRTRDKFDEFKPDLSSLGIV